MTDHALERIGARLTPSEIGRARTLCRALESAARSLGSRGSVAVRLFVLSGQRNEAWSNVSNGDAVWAVLRGGTVVTVMLRRSTQPSTAEAMRVDAVQIL